MLVAAAVPAGAATGPAAKLARAEAARRAALVARAAAAARAERVRAAAARLMAARVAAAARLRAAGLATQVAEAQLAALTAGARAAAAQVRAERAALLPLLPVIERLSLYPTESLLAAPVPPEQALRGVLVLRGVTRALAARLARLRAAQVRAAVARTAAAVAIPSLAAAERTQEDATAALDRALAATSADELAAETSEQAAARRAAALASQAADLRDLLHRLAVARQAAAARARRLAPNAGSVPSGPIHLLATSRPAHQLLRPVAGRVAIGFGTHTAAGPASGITWHARAGAVAVAPCSGTVLFAAPFRGYGRLLIEDCGGGYDAVIGGFARLDAAPGDRLRAGAAVGALPTGTAMGVSSAGMPSVYFELRRDGAAIDPGPWLRGG